MRRRWFIVIVLVLVALSWGGWRLIFPIFEGETLALQPKVLGKEYGLVAPPEEVRLILYTEDQTVTTTFWLDEDEVYEGHSFRVSLLELIDVPEWYAPYSVVVRINDEPLATISSEDLSDQNWKSRYLPIPAEHLHAGFNTATLQLDTFLKSHYVRLYSKEDPDALLHDQLHCYSINGQAPWNCLPSGYWYSLVFEPKIDYEKILPEEVHYLLDEEQFGLLNCEIDPSTWGAGNEYFVNLSNHAQFEELYALASSFEGTDWERATQIMDYILKTHVDRSLVDPLRSYNNNSYDFLFIDDNVTCSTAVYSFITLLYLSGIDARPIFLDESEDGGHVTAEVYLDDQWVMFDPFWNITFSYEGNPFSAKEIHENLEVYDHRLKSYYETFNEVTVLCGGAQLPYYEDHLPSL